jgi:hypothetical protein
VVTLDAHLFGDFPEQSYAGDNCLAGGVRELDEFPRFWDAEGGSADYRATLKSSRESFEVLVSNQVKVETWIFSKKSRPPREGCFSKIEAFLAEK